MKQKMLRIVIPALLTLAWAPLHAAPRPLKPTEVPTFQLRARVTSCENRAPDGKSFTFLLGDARVTVTGSAWTEWLAFGTKQIEVAFTRYPNITMNQYRIAGDPDMVAMLTVNGVVDPTLVDVETRLTENGLVTAHAADLFGPRLAILVWRDEKGESQVSTSAEFNKRYWAVFQRVSIPDAERPKFFPIIDRFDGQGDDRNEWVDGISNLCRVGFTAMEVPAEPRFRDMLLQGGMRRTSGARHAPTEFDFSTPLLPPPQGSTRWEAKARWNPPEEIDAWAHDRVDPLVKAGFTAENLALFSAWDEPSWKYPQMYQPLMDSPQGLQEFHDYLASQGLTPRDLGAANWDQVLPIGRSKAADLPSRRLFYWTSRFFMWAASRHCAAYTRALEQAAYPGLPVTINWNTFAGRVYDPGPSGHQQDPDSPDAATGGFDWLEFGRLRGCTMLATEDWFSDAWAPQWSYYCARLRAGAERGGVNFGGLVIPVSAGDRQGGIIQKDLTIIGSGGKSLVYFIFGPEYTFPNNCYSEKCATVIPQMAEAHRMIGKAEDLLWPGKRPRAQVAMLYPRSANLWDQRNVPHPRGIVDETNNRLNQATVDYMAEVFNLYVALQHADVLPDFVEEEDLSPKNLAPYKVLYVTEPDIPAEYQQGLLAWVRKGGTLVTVTGAGAGDRYDDPCDILLKGLGVTEQPRERQYMESPGSLNIAGEGTGRWGAFTAFGPRGRLTGTPAAGMPARFADGAPAMIERKVGRGRLVHFPWMPGLSYMKSAPYPISSNAVAHVPPESPAGQLQVRFSEAIRGMITYPVQAAKVVPPVMVDRPMIETPLLLSKKGAAVTLLNWSGEVQKDMKLTIRVPFAVKSVESVKQGKLTYNRTGKGITLTLQLDVADILMLRP